MSNQLVGELYRVIIDKVVEDSRTAFEEFGIVHGTLEDLQVAWQQRISAKKTAEMPWDPKPVQQQPQPAQATPSTVSNGMTSSYPSYDTPPSTAAPAPRLKQESEVTHAYNGLPNGYAQQPQGGAARAAQLMQQQYGQAAVASVNAMQRGGGLALPGGQQQTKPQLHLPAQSPPISQQQYQRQQQQQFPQPPVKLESDSPHLSQQGFQQQNSRPNYNQTDGAEDDDALGQWRTMLAQRRALHAAHSNEADHLMRDTIQQQSIQLQSGLMMPLDELPSSKRMRRVIPASTDTGLASDPQIPQVDGNLDEDDDEKKDAKADLSDEDAINSDLDDDEDPNEGGLGDDDDDNLDTILCTYDKVQRVKNKWKCTLKDGIMSANGKEWVFMKGMGEFEW